MSAEADADDGRMTLVEHLTELRRRVIICAVVARRAARSSCSSSTTACCTSSPARTKQVTQGQRGRAAATTTHGLQADRDRPARAVPRAVEDRRPTAGSRSSVPIIFWEIWRFVTPGLHKNERRYGVGFLIVVGRAVRARRGRGVVHASSRRSSSCSASGGSSDPAVHHRRQVPDARHADDRRVRRRVRVPAADRVLAAGPGRQHPPAAAASAAG